MVGIVVRSFLVSQFCSSVWLHKLLSPLRYAHRTTELSHAQTRVYLDICRIFRESQQESASME